MPTTDTMPDIPEDLVRCAAFHGHICPGLVYGYLVAKEAMKLMDIGHASDEEIVAICENDSCAVDALQVLLGTSTGKGNLIIKDFGKNAYTVLSRSSQRSYRFVRKIRYEYRGKKKSTFERLDATIDRGTASENDRWQLKLLKIEDLLGRDFDEIFTTAEIPYKEPLYTPLERSEPCVMCGEMTMASKMVVVADRRVCFPCSQKG